MAGRVLSETCAAFYLDVKLDGSGNCNDALVEGGQFSAASQTADIARVRF